ncbi:MAG: tetratricopeptide repeat protein [Candidatus Pacebacteria bacterium]|nr:tetratricopeptide repeat protein [Candidatus Paceibacterota bacterium]
MMSEKIDSFATRLMMFVVFLLPVIFVPILFVSQQETKLFTLSFGVLIVALLWVVARLKENKVSIPMSLVSISFLALPLIALVAAVFSGNMIHSLVGQSLSMDTAFMMLVLSLGFGVGALLFNSKDKIIKLYLAMIGSALILFVFQVARLFLGEDMLSLSVLSGSTANLIGKWNDVAIFAGLITLLTSVTIETLNPRGLFRVLAYTGFLLALFMLVVVNFSLVWVVLAVLSFALLIRTFIENRVLTTNQEREGGSIDLSQKKTRGIAKVYLALFVISTVCIFAAPVFETHISKYFSLYQIEARPSWQSTTEILKKTYDTTPFFGVGPNNFSKEWLIHKPLSVNQTPFWNADFSFGVGTIPTFFVTQGILSVFTWVVLLGIFLFSGLRVLTQARKKIFDTYLLLSSFVGAVFLWVLSIFYVPHPTLFFFAFLLTGVFVAAQGQAGVVRKKEIVFQENVRAGFAGVVILFALCILLVVGVYVSVTKFTSGIYLSRAHIAANIDRNLTGAQESIGRARMWDESDRVYRSAAEVLLLRLSEILNQNGDPEEVGQQAQAVLSSAIESGRRAVSIDNQNYLNWIALGRIYESLVPLKVEGAYENAKISYEQVLALNPHNPLSELNLARVEMLSGNNQDARSHITASLKIKQDYTDALFLLSQIEVQEGDVENAISSIETAAIFAPNDPLVFFRLGLLRYGRADYEDAVAALERAVVLDEQYANARYFLGLSYYELGRRIDATREFTTIQSLDPNNTEVNVIIENLISGRAPLQNFAPPVDPLEALPATE